MSKELERIFNRMQNKDLPEVNVNGHMGWYGGESELESKINIKHYNGQYVLSHWGTPILQVKYTMDTQRVISYYGESKSDADLINQFLGLLDMYDYGATYRPSLNMFAVFDENVVPVELLDKKAKPTNTDRNFKLKVVELIGSHESQSENAICDYEPVTNLNDELAKQKYELVKKNCN